MPHYVVLMDFTQRGIEDVEHGPERIEAGRQMVESMGGELLDIYVTMGAHDYVAIVDAPDDDAAARMALALGKDGNVSTETMRAFTEDEYADLVSGLP